MLFAGHVIGFHPWGDKQYRCVWTGWGFDQGEGVLGVYFGFYCPLEHFGAFLEARYGDRSSANLSFSFVIALRWIDVISFPPSDNWMMYTIFCGYPLLHDQVA